MRGPEIFFRFKWTFNHTRRCIKKLKPGRVTKVQVEILKLQDITSSPMMFQCRRRELAIRESSCSKHYLVVLLCSYEANHPLQHCFRSSVPSLCIPYSRFAIFPLSRTHFDRKNILASQYQNSTIITIKFLMARRTDQIS